MNKYKLYEIRLSIKLDMYVNTYIRAYKMKDSTKYQLGGEWFSNTDILS